MPVGVPGAPVKAIANFISSKLILFHQQDKVYIRLRFFMKINSSHCKDQLKLTMLLLGAIESNRGVLSGEAVAGFTGLSDLQVGRTGSKNDLVQHALRLQISSARWCFL